MQGCHNVPVDGGVTTRPQGLITLVSFNVLETAEHVSTTWSHYSHFQGLTADNIAPVPLNVHS